LSAKRPLIYVKEISPREHSEKDGEYSSYGMPNFEMDDVSGWRQNNAMGQAERLRCPKCGAYLILVAAPSHWKGPRKFQCFECDGPDPLKTDQVTGWLKGELQPPT
jgi:hypothetical protein